MIYLILNLVTPPRHILSLSRGYAPAPMSRPPLPARARARGSPRRACPRPSERLSPTAPAHFQISNSLSVHGTMLVHAISRHYKITKSRRVCWKLRPWLLPSLSPPGAEARAEDGGITRE